MTRALPSARRTIEITKTTSAGSEPGDDNDDDDNDDNHVPGDNDEKFELTNTYIPQL